VDPKHWLGGGVWLKAEKKIVTWSIFIINWVAEQLPMLLNWLQMCGSCLDTCSFENPIFKNVCRTLVGLFQIVFQLFRPRVLKNTTRTLSLEKYGKEKVTIKLNN
jgi:hypothetical protein